MFVRDFIEVSQPFDAVAPRLVRNVDWLDPITRHAIKETMATSTALHPNQSIPRALSLKGRSARGPVRARVDGLDAAALGEQPADVPPPDLGR